MNDAALTWLSQCIQRESSDKALWCSDENVLRAMPEALSWSNKPQLISNRWDVATQARALGFDSRFSDFDFSHIEDGALSKIFYRVSKEKPVVHHIINAAHRLLAPNGQLFLSGQKNEGIKTYIDKASTLFGCAKAIKKDGITYTSVLRKLSAASIETQLDDSAYRNMRAITSLDTGTREVTVYSKPGIFGWNKTDQGSAFLIKHLPELLESLPKPPESLLDLGCGYGYLSLMTAELPVQRRALTDNNAAALFAAEYNCAQNAIRADVIAADCGDTITKTFDLILCNPPFHQGFSVDGDLTDKFISSCKRLLAPGGTALFVVNQFIPLERKAQGHFKNVRSLANNGSFKLITLT